MTPPNENIVDQINKFNYGGKEFEDLLRDHETLGDVVAKQAAILAEHQGTLKGIFPTVSAVQASLGAWLAVVSIVTAVLIGFAIFNLGRTNAVGDRIDGLATRTGGVEVRMGALDTRLAGLQDKIDLVPERVANELRSQPSGKGPARKAP